MDKQRLGAVTWIKSSYSGDNGGDCVEVAPGFPGRVPVRDSKNPGGAALAVSPAGWASFLATVKDGGLST
jgi:hypothetical protein